MQCAVQFLHCSVQWYSRSALFAVQLLQCSVFQHAGLYTFANGFLALSYIDLEQLFWPCGMSGVKISKISRCTLEKPNLCPIPASAVERRALWVWVVLLWTLVVLLWTNKETTFPKDLNTPHSPIYLTTYSTQWKCGNGRTRRKHCQRYNGPRLLS